MCVIFELASCASHRATPISRHISFTTHTRLISCNHAGHCHGYRHTDCFVDRMNRASPSICRERLRREGRNCIQMALGICNCREIINRAIGYIGHTHNHSAVPSSRFVGRMNGVNLFPHPYTPSTCRCRPARESYADHIRWPYKRVPTGHRLDDTKGNVKSLSALFNAAGHDARRETRKTRKDNLDRRSVTYIGRQYSFEIQTHRFARVLLACKMTGSCWSVRRCLDFCVSKQQREIKQIVK